MTHKFLPAICLLALPLSFIECQAGQNLPQQMQFYQQQGIQQVDAGNGNRLWYLTNGKRSCTSCHGDSPVETGKHANTGKVIEPMALSVNPLRFQDTKKIEKWFLRNCKWTFSRQCSSQEKADILTWLSNQ